MNEFLAKDVEEHDTLVVQVRSASGVQPIEDFKQKVICWFINLC